MSSKFKISINATIKWPNRCTICETNTITNNKAYGSSFAGISSGIFGLKLNLLKLNIFYPLCLKHKHFIIIMRSLMFISFIVAFFSGTLALSALSQSSNAILIFFVSSFILIISIKQQPILLKNVGFHFVTLIIRNEPYAKEFSLLNNINKEKSTIDNIKEALIIRINKFKNVMTRKYIFSVLAIAFIITLFQLFLRYETVQYRGFPAKIDRVTGKVWVFYPNGWRCINCDD